MSTRSMIGIVNEDKTVTAIYCHFDGYPSHNGEILTKHYTSRKVIGELMERGDIRYLTDIPEHCEVYDQVASEYANQEAFYLDVNSRWADWVYVWGRIEEGEDGIGRERWEWTNNVTRGEWEREEV